MRALLETSCLSLSIGQKIVCDNLSLSMHEGEIWGLLGANGSGKTTLLHALAGLQPIMQGDIYLQKKNLAAIPRKEIAKLIGILFQDTAFSFPQSVFEFCYSGRHPHTSSAAEDKKIINDILLEMDLLTLVKQNTQTLSGGEQRRLAIATVLIQTPRVFLLDEPTNHLDIRHQMHILHYFKNLCKTAATGVMMSLHDIRLAQQFCTHLCMLFPNGKTLLGKTNEILTSENISSLYNYPLKITPMTDSVDYAAKNAFAVPGDI
jgi:iron complex transport system ATP-binding protein